MSGIFLCGPDEVQPWDWPPCPHPDVQADGICCTCEHKVRPSEPEAEKP